METDKKSFNKIIESHYGKLAMLENSHSENRFETQLIEYIDEVIQRDVPNISEFFGYEFIPLLFPRCKAAFNDNFVVDSNGAITKTVEDNCEIFNILHYLSEVFQFLFAANQLLTTREFSTRLFYDEGSNTLDATGYDSADFNVTIKFHILTGAIEINIHREGMLFVEIKMDSIYAGSGTIVRHRDWVEALGIKITEKSLHRAISEHALNLAYDKKIHMAPILAEEYAQYMVKEIGALENFYDW